MKQPSRARMKLVRALFTALLGSSLFVVTVQANQVQSATDSVNRAQTNITSPNVEGSTTSSFQAGPNIAMVQTKEGILQGYIHDGIYTYHGVAYAEGTERFKRAHLIR